MGALAPSFKMCVYVACSMLSRKGDTEMSSKVTVSSLPIILYVN